MIVYDRRERGLSLIPLGLLWFRRFSSREDPLIGAIFVSLVRTIVGVEILW